MIFTANPKTLHDALAPLARIAASHTTIPILAFVRIVADGDRIKLTTCDLDREAEIWTAARIESRGEICLPAAKLLDALRGVQREASVRFAAEKGAVRISAGRARFTLPSLPAEDFASLGEAKFPAYLTLDAAALAADLSLVSHAISSEETRYYLNGVFFDASREKLVLVATDGHRLAKVETEAAIPEGANSILLPTSAVKELQRLAAGAKAGETLILWTGPTCARAIHGDLTLTSKLIDGTFPDYSRVIPASPPLRFEVEAEALAGSLARVRIAASERGTAVRFAFDGNLRLSCRNSEGGDAEDEIDCHGDGGIEIGFNGKYAAEAIAALNVEQLVIRASDPGAPAILTSAANPARLVVLMPLRI